MMLRIGWGLAIQIGLTAILAACTGETSLPVTAIATATQVPATPIPAPTTTPAPTPTPTPTPIPHPHIESQDGSILIIYEVPTTQEEMESDLKRVQHITGELAKVYGRLPYGQFVLKKGIYGPWGESYITVPRRAIPTDLCEGGHNEVSLECTLAFHELGHYFTHNLLRTDQLWFDEGLSIVIGTSEENGFIDLEHDFVAHDDEVYSSHNAGARVNYHKLKNGKNIYTPSKCTASEVHEDGQIIEVEWDCINELGAHSVGYMFFYALAKDYGINKGQLWEFVRTLVELSNDGRMIGTDDLRAAVQEVSGEDIMPLLNLMEPGIKFNGYDDGNGINFIKRHPEYASDETLWVD